MNDILRFGVIGLASGSIIALLGLGMNVVYRTSRVVNFAHATTAIAVAYAYSDLVDVLPTPVALLASVALGLILGGAFELLVMRFLRSASALTKAIATIGLLIVLQSILTLRYGNQPVLVTSWLPTGPVDLGPFVLGLDRLIILAVCLVLTVVLYIAYRFTAFGVATTALAESPRSLAALGTWSPERIGVVNWSIGGGLAAVSGLLLAPISSLSPSTGLLLLVPVLTAALLGRMASFWLTFVGGATLGIAQAEIGRLDVLPGLADAVPFFVIVVILMIRGRSLPQRGEDIDALPRIGSGRIPLMPALVALALGLLLCAAVLDESWVIALSNGLAVGIVLLSIVVVSGYAGQLSLAPYALAGIAALVAAQLVVQLGWSFVPAALVGVLATIPVGLLVGLPAVRTRGTDLAIITLGLAVALQALVFDNPDISNGTTGLEVGSPSILGLSVDSLLYPRRYAILALLLFFAVGIGVLNLRRSLPGRRMVAARTNERATASVGVSVAATKLYAFVVSAVIAGIGGVVIAFSNFAVVLGNPGGRFDPGLSLNAIAESTVGGIGYVGGALIGPVSEPDAVVGHALGTVVDGAWFTLVSGLLLVLTVIATPSGIAANVQETLARIPLPTRLRRTKTRRVKERPAEAVRMAAAIAPEDVPRTTLTVTGLSVQFGGNRVLDGVDLELNSGEVLGVIGANGAGKSTLVDAITGFAPVVAGHVMLGDTELTSLTPARRARAGVTRSFQSLELFEDLTVEDNLLVAAGRPRGHEFVTAPVVARRHTLDTRTMAALAGLGLLEQRDAMPSTLSYGERRLLAIARALATRPQVLLLDEPAAGLGAEERQELADLITVMAREWQIAILVIEHDVDLVLGVSDSVVALDFGRVIARGVPDEIRRDPAVIRAYLGSDDSSGPTTPSDLSRTDGALA